MNKLIVYLPCYNEAENIEALTALWLEEAPALEARGYLLELVPVDDKSTDNTLPLITRLAAEHAAVRVIAHQVNRNLGGVLDTAVRDFLQRAGDGDLMCVMDGDNTHKPAYVHPMLTALEKAAARYGDKLITRQTFSCMMELLYKLHRCGCRFAEGPFTLRYDDKGGASKMRVVKTMVDSLSTALKLRLGR